MTTNHDRLEVLWRDHLPGLVAYARRRGASADDAIDIVAEVFLVAWRRIEDVPTDARPWLFGVARHVLANQRRGALRRTQLSNRLAQELVVSVHGVGDSSGAAASLRAALAGLHERDRELLTLVAWDGLTPSEAAQVLGLVPSTARVRLHRARRRLAEEMQRIAEDGQVRDGRRTAAPRTENMEVI